MGTKMFQFPTFALSLRKCRSFSPAGCPIRKSADRVVCANPRSLSQLITSFFAPESLGIHRLPSLYFFARIYILLHISSPLLHVEYTVIEFLSEVALRLHFNALLSFLFILLAIPLLLPAYARRPQSDGALLFVVSSFLQLCQRSLPILLPPRR